MKERKPLKIEAITFRTEGSDTYVTSGWPEKSSISEFLLQDLPTGLIERDGDMLSVTVTNGRAQYRLGAYCGGFAYEIELCRGWWEPVTIHRATDQ